MKVLIIDDEYKTRSEYYEKIFKDFDVDSVDEPCQLKNLLYKNYKVIAIDLYLWNQTSKESKTIISKIPQEIPIILISQRWNDSNGMPIEEIYTYTNNRRIIKIISFQRIIEASVEDVEKICSEYNTEIFIELNSFYQYNNTPIKNNDTITILHIADMQFGGNVSNAASFDVYSIYDFLEKNFLKPSIVLVAGDIAQGGKSDEYQEALTWFGSLKEKLFETDNIKNRIILTPGNHDANFDLFAGFVAKYDFKNKCFNLPEQCVDKNSFFENKTFTYKSTSNCSKAVMDQIIFNNFMHFAYKLTEDTRWLISPNHFNLVVNNFENLGIRIISFNSNANISASYKEDGKTLLHRGAGIDTNACEKIVSTLNNDNMFTIVLSHLGASEMGKDNEDLSEQWKSTRNFLDNVRADLWLCGHNHVQKSSLIDDDLARYICDKPCVYAGSLRLGANSLPEGARRSFNIIQLIRENAIVKSIKVIPFEINNNLIERKKEKTYDCCV